MGAGVYGAVILAAVELVVGELNTGLELVALHLHFMEGTIALDHQLNLIHAIRTVVHVRIYNTNIQILLLIP